MEPYRKYEGKKQVREIGRCKSCGMEIIWGRTSNNKSIPLDPVPQIMFVFDTVNGLSGRVQKVFRVHFASCPNADFHRKSVFD
jgi:hypothetical protein